MKERNKKSFGSVIALFAVLIGFGIAFVSGYATGQNQNGDNRNGTLLATSPVVETPATRDAATMQNAFAEVAQAVGPAVVTITTTRSAPARSNGRPPAGRTPAPGQGQGQGQDPFDEFFDFFRRFPGFDFSPNAAPLHDETGLLRPVQLPGRGSPGGGLGSGFIFRADGLIMTNAHVLRDASEVTVKLADERSFKAKVLGVDERTDVAVIKIEADKLPVAKLGDSKAVRVGDWAVAMGNPFGLEKTLTVGVISAKAREVPLSQAGPGDYLQTDASINPGNSGGPLLDIYGRVIGVNNAIYSRSGGNIGIGFAIPINTARDIADQLVREGKVTRAYLGVRISDVGERAVALGLDPQTKGVLIEQVEANSPASRAGMQPGDVVTSINGTTVTTSRELQRLVSSAKVGSTADFKVLRAGKTVTLNIKLEELKDGSATPRPATSPDGGGTEGTPSVLGLRLSPLTAELTRQFSLKADKGVFIAAVENGSPAAAADLRRGDVIERVGQTAVSTPQDVQNTVKAIVDGQTGDDKRVALYVNRQGERRFITVTGVK